jgi:chitinase
MAINPGLGFVLAQQVATQEGLPPNRAIFYGALGALLPTPVGLGVALALANQEAAAQPAPPQPQPQAPGQVTGLNVTARTANSVSLSWTAPSDGGAVLTYAVQFSAQNANAFATAASSGPGTSTTVAGLIPFSTYDFRVIAANAAGFGPPSDLATATTLQPGYSATG